MFLCSKLVVVRLVVSAIDCVEKLVSEMTYHVSPGDQSQDSSWTLNYTHCTHHVRWPAAGQTETEMCFRLATTSYEIANRG